MMAFEERRPVALVTGGCGAVGRELVQRLVARGYEVHVADKAAEMPGLARAEGAQGHVCDVTNEQSVGALPIEGALDVLINAAGIWPASRLESTSLDLWNRVLAVNLTGTFLVTRRFVPALRSARGIVVNIASAVALKGNVGMGAYAAAKAGVLGLTRAFARELGDAGVRVNAVAPGLLDTEANRVTLPGDAFDRALSERCLRQPQTAVDAAEAALLFLSPGAAMATGQTLVVDGGVAFH